MNNYSPSDNKKIKIAFVSKPNPKDKHGWSGSMYKLYENIESMDNIEIEWIQVKRDYFQKTFYTCIKSFTSILKKGRSQNITPFSKRIAKQIEKKINNDVDIIFVPSSPAYFAYLNANKPIISLVDTTFKSIYNYYPGVTNYFKFNEKQEDKIEVIAATKAWKIITASNWAKNSYINDYNINKEKIKVIEFGANIDNFDINPTINYLETGTLSLLFLGVDWVRKGGEIAVECVEHLNKIGIKAILNVVGVELPTEHKEKSYINEIGFLSKNNEAEYTHLKQIIYNSDFLLLPTRAECAGVVFCEASAYGLPTLTSDTGGIPDYIINGINGYRLNLNCNGQDYANKITNIINSNELKKLKEGAIKMYNEKLNWNHWQKEFRTILNEYRNGRQVLD